MSRVPEHEASVGELVERFRAIESVLKEHAAHEDRWVEPVLRELRPDLAEELAGEHTRLHAQLEEVAAAFATWTAAGDRMTAGHLAHGALAAFVGPYLTHMSREENEAMPVIQAAMADEQILAISANLRGSIPPPRLAEFMAFMLPAMNIAERSALFTGLKANAPAEVLDGMCHLAAEVLDAASWSAVCNHVGI
ncbi:MAG: hemerythrin domain-containing protein [Deltaproteobacteria bacterium]|nr:hemerythrin domain-containing protein [Deltaproteobacteria bacterium]